MTALPVHCSRSEVAARLREVLLQEALPGAKLPYRVWSHCASQVLEWVNFQLQQQLSQRATGSRVSKASDAIACLWKIFTDLLGAAQQSGRSLLIPDVVPSLVSHCQWAVQLLSRDISAFAMPILPVLPQLLHRRSERLLGSMERR